MRYPLHIGVLLALAAFGLPARSQALVAAFEADQAGAEMRTAIGGHDLDGDGWDDLIVGSPLYDLVDTDGGRIQAYSGQTGAVLWTRWGTSPGVRYGYNLAFIADTTGDGVPEFVAVAPNSPIYRVFDSASGAMLLAQQSGLGGGIGYGSSLASGFDWNLDGIQDFAIGAPLEDTAAADAGRVEIYDGVSFLKIGSLYGENQGDQFGAAVAGVGDVVAPGAVGYRDLAVGAPGFDAVIFSTFENAGKVYFYGIDIEVPVLAKSIGGSAKRQGLGAAIAGVPDIDGDGFDEFLVGEPGYSTSIPTDWRGRVRLLAGTTHQTLGTFVGDAAFDRLGSSTARLADLDCDGFDDFVIGALPIGSNPGYARVFSAALQTELFTAYGAPQDGFGTRVGGAGDFNDDGLPDVWVSAPLHDGLAGIDTGGVWVYSGTGSSPVGYCTAGTSASGCQAGLSATGTPSATAVSGFQLQASGVEGKKDGHFFFAANGRQANPWGNGTSYQCVVPPVKRGGLLVATGTQGACDGSFAQDLNALWCPSCPKPVKNPGVGAVVQAQLWYRDPANTSNQTTSLSDALEFVVCP